MPDFAATCPLCDDEIPPGAGHECSPDGEPVVPPGPAASPCGDDGHCSCYQGGTCCDCGTSRHDEIDRLRAELDKVVGNTRTLIETVRGQTSRVRYTAAVDGLIDIRRRLTEACDTVERHLPEETTDGS